MWTIQKIRRFVLLRKEEEEEEEVKEEKHTLARTVVKAWNSSFCALVLLLFPLFSLNSLLFVFFSSRECVKRNEERDERKDVRQKFRKNTKERKLLSLVCVKTREPKRKKERKKEKERANATTRIIILSIAQYHHHLLCASVIFHYSN